MFKDKLTLVYNIHFMTTHSKILKFLLLNLSLKKGNKMTNEL